jgi:hypothetical protein
MDPNDAKDPGTAEEQEAARKVALEKEEGDKKLKETGDDDGVSADVLKKAVDAALAPIKAKLDEAYTKRDEALAQSAEHEQKTKEVERERMREQGKESEALQSELDEFKAKDKVKDSKIVELTRNMEVNSMLASLEFRSDKSRKMAFEEIVSELVQEENGNWKHKSGSDLSSFVKSFSEDDDNSFLFKTKESSGAGVMSPQTKSSVSSKGGSVFDLSQDEVIKRAQEGTLKPR